MNRASLVATALLLSTALAPATFAAETPLIERAKLFGNPSRAQGTLSPDGKHLSWIAPRDGVMNVWVAPTANLDAARPLTNERTRPIRQHFWAPDGTQIMFVQDKGGDENFLLYAVDIASGQERNLTPFEKTRVQIVGTSRTIKDRILVGLNNRDARWHDVYSLDLKSGKLTEIMKADGFAGFLADQNLQLRIASKPNDAGGSDYYRVVDNVVAAQPFTTTTLADQLTTQPAGFTSDGSTLYWLDSRDRDTGALIAQTVATGATRVIAENPKADIGRIIADPKTGVVQAWGANHLRNVWTPIDPGVGADLAFLQSELKGDINVTSQTDDNTQWTVSVDPVTSPPSVWLYDRPKKALKQLYVSRPELANAPLAAMYPREIAARDGLNLVSYLTLPYGSDPDGDGKPDRAVPMVLFVHGGPWARDNYGYNSAHQWLSNRGYAVLSVNYRGSTGFGKKFISAGDLQWGTKMHDDLIDAVGWAVREGITSKDKVAIMGGSYGGYATLAGLTFTPTTFACGVDIVGPSNLQTLLKTVPPYWTAGIQQFHQRMGNPTTAEGRKLLDERSPLYKADQIVRPLLIGQGANDPRVNQAESDQIVAAMKAKGIPVTYVLFPDEGHGFARPANNIAFNAVAESFLGKCLGGRFEPIGATVRQSSAKIPHGAEYAPGLTEALK